MTPELSAELNRLNEEIASLRRGQQELTDLFNKSNLFESLAGLIWVKNFSSTKAGGEVAYKLGSSGIGIYWGSGAPTIAAAKSSLYLRTDGSSTSTRAYINTDGGTTWTNITTAA